MASFRFAFLAATFVLAGILSANAQPPRPRFSPHDATCMVIDGNRVTIFYGRPYSKDPTSGHVRKVWGTLVPYGKVWRFGADEATLLVTQQPIQIGETTLPAGAYSLFMLPDKTSAKLIVNKQIGQWGLEYDEKQDFARIELRQEPLKDTADQFTIAIENNPEGGGLIRILWENTQFIAPFTVKK
jgi:hypothetical protein